ncbi:hypothetical protein LguiA_017258 [Lonicera macranthoides]
MLFHLSFSTAWPPSSSSVPSSSSLPPTFSSSFSTSLPPLSLHRLPHVPPPQVPIFFLQKIPHI